MWLGYATLLYLEADGYNLELNTRDEKSRNDNQHQVSLCSAFWTIFDNDCHLLERASQWYYAVGMMVDFFIYNIYHIIQKESCLVIYSWCAQENDSSILLSSG